MESAQEIEERFGAAIFQKFPLTIVKGKGAKVWDQSGGEYVDFMAGIGVAIVGHCNPDVVEAVKSQAEKLITCHGSFYNDARSGFLERLASVAPKGLDKAVLTNSGTETVEAALKLARRYTGRKKFVSMKGAFHGKTMGALSATWNKKYREPFAPLVDGVEFAEFGNAASVAPLVTNETAAVIAEPIQGETGVIIPPPDFLKEVREICDRAGALLILDEIQSGLGRTGRMWASEHWGVVPDIMATSKGLGGGVPLGAALTTPEIASRLQRGEHTGTFAGNPLACAAGSAALDFIRKNNLPAVAETKGKRLKERLVEIASGHKVAREVRGLGMMLALETRIDIHQLLLDAIGRGAIFAYSGKETFRLLPPLVIDDSQIARGMEVLEGVLDAEDKRRFG
ncbi:MAG TPA: aspartate aminotransferase family protein [Nitrososphaerales archaeon]|nr:aspartate aminotransferase family protein [Nitrososphaerales archaeon]